MIQSGVPFMKNAVKKRDFPLTLTIPGSGHIVKNSKMQGLPHCLAADLIQALHRHTALMH